MLQSAVSVTPPPPPPAYRHAATFVLHAPTLNSACFKQRLPAINSRHLSNPLIPPHLAPPHPSFSLQSQIWNYLGLARVSMGDIRDGCKAYQKALELDPSMREAWLNLGQACKEEARVDEADKALCKVCVC